MGLQRLRWELGNNTTTPSSTPVEVVGPGGAGVLSGVVAIAANYGDTLALKSDGTVWAWGDNTYGQLGINSFTSSLTPVEVLGPGGAGNLSGIIQACRRTDRRRGARVRWHRLELGR